MATLVEKRRPTTPGSSPEELEKSLQEFEKKVLATYREAYGVRPRFPHKLREVFLNWLASIGGEAPERIVIYHTRRQRSKK